jgi:hypothetical protein
MYSPVNNTTTESQPSYEVISPAVNFLRKPRKALNKAKFRRNEIVSVGTCKMVLQQIINENAGRTTTNDVIRQFRNYRGSANEYGLNIDAKLGRTAAHNFLYLLGDLDSPYKEEDDDEDDNEDDDDDDEMESASPSKKMKINSVE